MQIKLYTIPVFGSEAIEEELNRFLRGHRILQLERHFCADNGGYWAIMIEYVDGDPVAEAPDKRAMLFYDTEELRCRAVVDRHGVNFKLTGIPFYVYAP